jgi:hypothetical protein
MCLANDAVYVAREGNRWYAVGAQFQHPYVFKTLFSGDPITFNDLCETKQVTKGAMYLDFEHNRPAPLIEGMQFVGRTGRFVPVKASANGAILYRVTDEKTYAVSGTKNYLWLEADMVEPIIENLGLENAADVIDMGYFERLVDDAVKTIEQFGSFDDFVGR